MWLIFNIDVSVVVAENLRVNIVIILVKGLTTK